MMDKAIAWARDLPKTVRIATGVLLVLGGFVGFLPVLGFWMIPAGLVVLAIDVPFLRPYVARARERIECAVRWAKARWRRWHRGARVSRRGATRR
jgi:hypothetical protein